jgi:excisionase family DNA binding protein
MGGRVHINSQGMSDHIIRLSVSEAAKLFGVSSQTVRRAISDGLVNYVVVQNRYKISFESLVKWSQASAHVKNKSEAKGIGQFVGAWKITNKKFSPNPAILKKEAGTPPTTKKNSPYPIDQRTPPTPSFSKRGEENAIPPLEQGRDAEPNGEAGRVQ